MKIEQIIKKHLRSISEGEDRKHENYMFFGNIEQMKRQCEIMMNENHEKIDSILKEHDWAQDHISEAKSLLDQVFDFIMNETTGDEMDETYLNEEYQIDEGENCPTDSAKWSASKAAAKAKFDIYPSAYANGWAAKNYKAKGGGWKKCKKSTNEEKKSEKYEVYHKSYTSAINAALDYAEKRGFTYDKEETSTKIGMGPKKPSEGKTNRITISLFKDDKEQKKSLHIQVYRMGEKYELNCYIN